MIPEETKSDRAYNQLGLPPMELAEPSNERSSRCLYRCIYPTLQKIFLMMVLITFSIGLYVLVLKVLSAPDTNQKTEIILVTGQDTHNVTVNQNDWQIWFQLKNHSETNLKRKKRDLNEIKQKEMLDNLSADDLERAKEIIRNHNSLCHSDKHKDTCSELIEKLDRIINHSDANSVEAIDVSNTTDSKKQISDQNEHVDISPSDVLKRHTNALNKIRNDMSSDQETFSNPLHKTINILDSDANYNMQLPNQFGQNFPNYLGQGLSMGRPNQLGRQLLNNFEQDVSKNVRDLPNRLGQVVPDNLKQDISRDHPNHFGQGVTNYVGQTLPNHVGQGFPNHLGQSLPNHLEQGPSNDLGQSLSNHLGQGISNHLGQDLSNHFGRSLSNHEQGVLNLNPQLGVHTHLSDTCLLAKLLKRNYPNAQEIYDPQSPELSQFAQSHFPQTSNLQSSLQPFMKHREVENSFQKLHPQDLNIFMNFFNKQNFLTPDDTIKKSSRAMQCPLGSLPCGNSEDCVQESEWCDGNVDCADASDEVRCSCRSRIDKSRLCDGYFDCPFGEDEMGCFGCSDTTFSCGNAQNSCFTKEQRCNSINDCPNHRDEIECNMLAPTLSNKPMFAVSNTEGYLHRNFKGDWYAVCQNPYMWAHDACRRETGLIIRPPMMQVVPVDPTMKVKYLNTGPGGFMQTSEACFNSSAIYVTCPDLLCGTRVQTTIQSLREDMDLESQLFGRNKRFLYPFFEPYRTTYYGNRKKRDTSDVSNGSNNDKMNSGKLNKETGDTVNNNRLKRAEERVVGGKASQPAAWPWMAAIYRDGMFHCGGVILNQFWIVSAAHCFHKFWDHYYEVQVGMLRRFSFSPQEHNHRVAHVIVNHGYSEADMISDLSLLKVEPAIQFSRWVRPICLPSPHTAGPDWMWGPSPGTVCTAVGWGATVEHGADPDHLREVKLPVWEHCKHREDTEGKEICAGFAEGGKDACQGDSGGPLLCRNPLNSQQWYLAGIVSHGDGCARKDEPGVYTRVSLFVKWIKYHTSSKSLPLVQPKQDCPGFKCFSGVSKCLPNSRKCDKIVDCLDAEDETNCSFMRLSKNMDAKIRNSTKSKSGVLKVSREASAELFSSEIDKETDTETTNVVSSTTEKHINLTTKLPTTVVNETHDIEPLSTLAISRTQSITEKHINSSTTQPTTVVNEIPNFEHASSSEISSTKSVTEKHINLSTKYPTTVINKTPDFEHASTLEISHTQSTEENNLEDYENVTEDSVKNGNLESFSENESHSIVITKKPDLLESRSSIIEQTTDSNIESNSKSITKELSTEAITTTLASDINTNRGDVNSDDTNTLNNLLTTAEATTTEATFVNNNHKNNTENLFVQLSLGPISQPNETSIEVSDNKINGMTNLSQSHETSEENDENVSNELTALKNNGTLNNLEAKNLPNTKNGHVALPSIEDIVLSEIKLASIKRKPRVPKEFECRRIFQVISYNRRCDRKADCEDGTDELDCMCVDYLLAFDEKLICDGIFDCADGQDEIDCFSCPEEHFLCKRSETCVPKKYVCDGKIHCSLGEDEQNCFTLSNGRELVLDIDEKPQVNLEGFLTKRKNDDWSVVCDDKLDMEQQEVTATHICRYLGFSGANKYLVKYVNIKNEDIVRPGLSEPLLRAKRASARNVPLNFVFTELASDNKTSRNVVIEEPRLIKEECVPNVTRTCKSLYVVCDRALFTNFEIGDNTIFSRAAESEDTKISSKMHMWPWIAKVYVDGDYKCTGILVDVAWVLVSDSCLWDTSPMHNFITVSLGSHRTLNSIYGWNEQNIKVTAKKHLYKSRTVLLYLKSPAKYSNMVKPMTVASPYYTNGNIICVAVGEDNHNNTISVFLNETTKNCKLNNRCFVRRDNDNICPFGEESHRNWSGLISCHSEHGWYPAASFVDSRGECGLGNIIVGTDIENLRFEIKYYTSKVLLSESAENISDAFCHGVRCGRGRCVPLALMCDGVSQCEDGIDESEFACTNKHSVCSNDTFQHGCECSASEMKCKNGRCISKSLFRDGKDDCEDGSDEPLKTKCADYLAAVTPTRLCDGVLHCDDRSDENPMFCKCFAKNSYMCSHSIGADYCIAPDMLCDGIRDCPNGDDERHCIGLTAPKGSPYGTGQVIVRSHGVWRSKCYPTQNHTKSELEAICSELGFLSGHAKEIKDDKYLVYSHNNLILEPFADVVLNNHTVIKLRNTNEPVMVKSFFDASLKNCFPVFIECL